MIGKIATLTSGTGTHRSTLQVGRQGGAGGRRGPGAGAGAKQAGGQGRGAPSWSAGARRLRAALTRPARGSRAQSPRLACCKRGRAGCCAPAACTCAGQANTPQPSQPCQSNHRRRRARQVEVHRLVVFVGALAFSLGIILFVVGVIRRIKTLDGARWRGASSPRHHPCTAIACAAAGCCPSRSPGSCRCCRLTAPSPPPTRHSVPPAFVNGFILVIVANVPEVRRAGGWASCGVMPAWRTSGLWLHGAPTCPSVPPPGVAEPAAPSHPARPAKGLPATVTSVLTLTALRLRDRNVLIKRTDIIENLGVATIIARWGSVALPSPGRRSTDGVCWPALVARPTEPRRHPLARSLAE